MTIKNNKSWIKPLARQILSLKNIQDNFTNSIRKKTTRVFYNDLSYTLSIPNKLCKIRAKTFATKEPETLKWIESFPKKSVFWDIGANVGLYSIHAAKARECIVYSFEPSVFNLEVLARNINLNDLCSSVTIMPFAVNDKMGRGDLNMSSENWGGALSTFDKSYGEDGEDFQAIFKYPIFSISMDEAHRNLNLPLPDYIKVDVDGIEHLILEGGTEVLGNIKGLLIEISDKWLERKQLCESCLIKAGLENITSSMVEKNKKNNAGSPNQIWARINHFTR